ncbi:MAG TPA: ATP synthase F1 subunit epsilon [Candidatus Kapabacteria bacterium]|nr:ATP synthase F1 subunit epsilon [Candidatus Kapabacteria bacterium]
MLTFSIVTPDGVTYQDDVDQVTIPTTKGHVTILPGHIPLVAILAPGELIAKKKDYEVPLAVSGGILEVRPGNVIYVLADTAERAEHIDVERAETARQRAEELMKQQHATDDVEFARLQAKIEKELARVRVGKKYRKL